SMGRTSVLGEIRDDRLNFDLSSYDEEDTVMYLGSSVGMAGDTINFHIDPNILILNKKVWSIPEDNRVLVGDKLLQFENFVWKSENQELAVSNDVGGVEEVLIGASFQDFGLSAFNGLLNPDYLIAHGLLNGDLILEKRFGATGILADL